MHQKIDSETIKHDFYETYLLLYFPYENLILRAPCVQISAKKLGTRSDMVTSAKRNKPQSQKSS